MKKIFIIGLPRTGTTSVCVALLSMGYKVAHSANTVRSIEVADVIGDTPAYCDYKKLDKKYPRSKFIYLDRKIEKWLPSVKNLLHRMYPGLIAAAGGFHPTVKRCYRSVFKQLEPATLFSDSHLATCYTSHRDKVLEYFAGRENDFLAINIGDEGAHGKMQAFLGLDCTNEAFPVVNANGQIVSWQMLQHKNKVPENL